MNDFSIDFKWLTKDTGDRASQATFAEIIITTGGLKATELLDQHSKTTRNGIRVSAYSMALWLAHNWWRLRWEPERSTVSWKMSHSVGAAGEGYLWPALSFNSDGEVVQIQNRPTPSDSPQPIRYLNDFDQIVPAPVFEREVDNFIDVVINRLNELSVSEERLSEIWNEVVEERKDEQSSLWRRIEAISGFDPGEAPELYIQELVAATQTIGTWAVEEIAAESELDATRNLQILWNGVREHARPLTIPAYDQLKNEISTALSKNIPWQVAAQAAHMARKAWSLEKGPVNNRIISELFSIENDFIVELEEQAPTTPFNVGYRNGVPESFSAFLKSPYLENRRFALLRLVGDHLLAPEGDRLLPAGTKSKTYRQKFQRAFAQELLCPFEELKNHLGPTEPTAEEIEEAAHYFIVSPAMIQSILVNRGLVRRERFFDDMGRSLYC